MKKLTSKARKRFGNRYGPLLASSAALLCVWLGNGLWHGAGSQYIFFGMYYFVLIVAGSLIEPTAARLAERLHISRESVGYRAFQIARTLVIIVVGELFFRAEGLDAGLAMCGAMFTDFVPGDPDRRNPSGHCVERHQHGYARFRRCGSIHRSLAGG